MNEPKLRFPGFTEDWKFHKVSELCSVATGKSNTQDKSENGQYPFYVRSPIVEKSTKYLYDEEAVITVGDGVGTGKVFHYVNGKYDLHQRCYRMYKFSDELNAHYFYYVFSKSFYKRVRTMTAKTSVDSVRMEMITDMKIPTPTVEEQQKIASLFTELDTLIQSAEKELEGYRELKQGMLQKMFPKKGEKVPEIRFPEFSGEWGQCKVGEITKFHKQGFYTTEEYDENKKYYLLRGTDLVRNKLILKDTPKVNATDKDFNAFKVEVGDFLIVRSGTVGTYGIVDVDIPAIFGSYLIDFRFDLNQVTNEFFACFYQSDLFKSQLNKITQASANTNINAENIKSTTISLPSIDEQKKIGEYFQNLDNLIASQEQELEGYKELKNGLLQQMLC